MEKKQFVRYFSTHFTAFTFLFPSFLIIGLFCLFAYWFTFPTMERYLLEGKKEVVQEQVRSAVTLLAMYEERQVAPWAPSCW